MPIPLPTRRIRNQYLILSLHLFDLYIQQMYKFYCRSNSLNIGRYRCILSEKTRSTRYDWYVLWFLEVVIVDSRRVTVGGQLEGKVQPPVRHQLRVEL